MKANVEDELGETFSPRHANVCALVVSDAMNDKQYYKPKPVYSCPSSSIQDKVNDVRQSSIAHENNNSGLLIIIYCSLNILYKLMCSVLLNQWFSIHIVSGEIQCWRWTWRNILNIYCNILS